MSDAGYSTAFSYLLLAATGAYCATEYHCNICTIKLACVSFGLITANALLGAWHWANKSEGSAIEKAYQITSFLTNITALPFIVTQVWLDYGYDQELANFHSLMCLVPFHLHLANKTNSTVIDMMIAVDAASLLIVSWMTDSLHGMAAAGSYLCTHFLFRSGHLDFDQSSVIDLQNYGLICFTYYSLMCLQKNPRC